MKIRIKQSLYIIIVALILLYAQNLIAAPSVMLDVLIVVYLLISISQDSFKIRYSVHSFLARSFLIPLTIWILYSVIVELGMGFTSDYVKHSITFFYRSILYFLLMKDTIFSYQERTPDYLLVSCIIAYIPAILKHFSKFGLINGIFIVFSAEANNMSLDLEVHGLTYVFGFLGLYYMYCSYVQKKEKKQMCVISIVLMLLGVKRIVIAATALTILLLLLMSKIKGKRRYVVIQLMCIVMIFAAYIYITILKNGTLEQIFNTYNIADNFRMNFANYLRNKYEISPSFLGYGMAYSHRIIVHEYSNIQYLTTAVNIHNDLLGIYLGTGFIGFGIYWYVFFFDRCSLLWKKYGSDSLLFAFLISFYYFMNMLVSNIGLDPFYYSVYFMVISVMCINNNGGKTN